MGHKYKCYISAEKYHVWNPWDKKTTIALENLPVSIRVGQGFGVFTAKKTEQGVSADTGSKLIKSTQEDSHKQRQT